MTWEFHRIETEFNELKEVNSQATCEYRLNDDDFILDLESYENKINEAKKLSRQLEAEMTEKIDKLKLKNNLILLNYFQKMKVKKTVVPRISTCMNTGDLLETSTLMQNVNLSLFSKFLTLENFALCDETVDNNSELDLVKLCRNTSPPLDLKVNLKAEGKEDILYNDLLQFESVSDNALKLLCSTTTPNFLLSYRTLLSNIFSPGLSKDLYLNIDTAPNITSFEAMKGRLNSAETEKLHYVTEFNQKFFLYLYEREERNVKLSEKINEIQQQCEEFNIDPKTCMKLRSREKLLENFNYYNVWTNPDNLFSIPEEEVGVRRYISDEEILAKKEDAERMRLYELNKINDFGYQSLLVMMDGVLDILTPKRTQLCYGKSVQNLSEEQADATRKKKRLQGEFKKIASEIDDIYKADDFKFNSLLQDRLNVFEKIYVLELEQCIVGDKVNREKDLVTRKKSLLESVNRTLFQVRDVNNAIVKQQDLLVKAKTSFSIYKEKQKSLDSEFKMLLHEFRIRDEETVKHLRSMMKLRITNFFEDFPLDNSTLNPHFISLLQDIYCKKQDTELKLTETIELISQQEAHINLLQNQSSDILSNFKSLCKTILTVNLEIGQLLYDPLLMVQIKLGQIESSTVDILQDNCVLIHQQVIDSANENISDIGKRKIIIFDRIKTLRHSLFLLNWEVEFLNFSKFDEKENYVDIHMIKFTKGLQQKLKVQGDNNQIHLTPSNLTEKLNSMTSFATNQVIKLKRSLNSYKKKIRRFKKENDALNLELVNAKNRVEISKKFGIEYNSNFDREASNDEAKIKEIIRQQKSEIKRLKALEAELQITNIHPMDENKLQLS